MADLIKNKTRQTIEIPGGFKIAPGGKMTIPAHAVLHPYTQSRLRNGRLEIVVEAKATKAKKAEPEAPAEPDAE